MNDLRVITISYFASLTKGEQEVVQELTNFKLMSSYILITLNQGFDSGIDEYLGDIGNDIYP